MSKVKRITALAMAIAVVLSLAACGKSNSPGTDTSGGTKSDTSAANGKLFTTPEKIKLLIGSHASWPYREDFKAWQYMEEATGADFDITAVPNAEFDTKLNLIMSSKDQLPDAVFYWSKNPVDRYALVGGYVSVLDNISKLPNFKKWMDATKEAAEIVTTFKSADGKLYWFPTYGLSVTMNQRGWLYRKDIFEKNKLSVPKDDQELYTVLKKLKELYPQSSPFSLRDGVGKFETLASQWGTGNHAYYDFDSSKWKYGPIEDNYKEMVVFFKKLYDDKLLPLDWATIDVKGWTEIVSSGNGFVMADYLTRIEFFDGPARKTDPNYTWALMPPIKGGSNGKAILPKSDSSFIGYAVCNTGDQKRIDNTLKFVDWMYGDQAKLITSWGKEGETFKVVNGKKEFILDDKGTTVQNLYGLSTYGTYQNVELASQLAQYTKESQDAMTENPKYETSKFNPTTWLPFNESEQEIMSQTKTTIVNYVEQQITKFILGQRPISEWNAYVEEVKKLGLDKMMDLYDKAYKRIVNAK